MPSYTDLKNFLIAKVEADYAASTEEEQAVLDTLVAALRDNGSAPNYNTTVLLESGGRRVEILHGSAFEPPKRRSNIDDPLEPDPDKRNKTIIAYVIRACAEWYDQNWKPTLNALIDDYNDRFSESFDNLD